MNICLGDITSCSRSGQVRLHGNVNETCHCSCLQLLGKWLLVLQGTHSILRSMLLSDSQFTPWRADPLSPKRNVLSKISRPIKLFIALESIALNKQVKLGTSHLWPWGCLCQVPIPLLHKDPPSHCHLRLCFCLKVPFLNSV